MLRSSSIARSRHLVLRVVAVFIIVLAFASAIHPYGVLKTKHSQRHDLETAITDSRVAAIVARSCANCHSDNTSWPWYSYVPPVSWLVEQDVAEARRDFNLSSWASYDRERKAELLADLARVVSNREMPLQSYLLHRDARLSDEDAQALIAWAGRERRTLRKSVASGKQQ